MPRVLGVDLPGGKRLEVSLTYIYGVGRKTSKKVLAGLSLDPNMLAKNLTDSEVSKLSEFLQKNFLVEGDLRREIQGNIKRLIGINCYRGMRHRLGLPVRGQRTRCNARTRRKKSGSKVRGFSSGGSRKRKFAS